MQSEADQPHSRRAGLTALVGALLLIALTVWSLAAINPPSPKPSDAAADAFSAARAFEHVEAIAAESHVTGSAANEEVREYLIATLKDLGLEPTVQEGIGFDIDEPGRADATRARNVVTVIPGSDPTGNILLVAHYDSAQSGPGAGDDGAGVASLLETARAITTGPQLKNDIVLLLTDAEEAGLLGAELFVSQHELAAEGGVVLNHEARGAGGPPIMFETTKGNAGVVDVYGAAAPHPVATSLAVEVYRVLPNDTDFTRFRETEGFTGLNSAFIDDSAAYHTPQDTPGRLSESSLQAMGDNTLAVTRALADADIDVLSEPSGYDATYFPVLGQLVRYPGWLVWPIAVLGSLAVAALVVVARRKARTSLPRALAGFGLAALPLVLAPLAAQAFWLVLVALRPGYAGMIDPWRPGWYRLAVVAIVAAVVLVWYALLRRRVGAVSLAIGGLGWLAVLGLVLAAFFPGGSYLAAVSALAGAVASIVGLLINREIVRQTAWIVGAAVAVIVLAPTVLMFFPALGLATAAVPALFAVLLGLAILPFLEMLFPRVTGRRARWASAAMPATAVVLAAGCTVVGLAVAQFDSTHPKPTQLMYALDSDTKEATWISTEDQPTTWTSQYVNGRADLSETFPYFDEELATGPANVADLAPPTVTVVSDDVVGEQRNLTVRMQPERPVRLITMRVSADAPIEGAMIAGREVPARALGENELIVTFNAPSENGVEVSVSIAGDGPVDLHVMDGSTGLTELPGFVPRPPDVGIAGTHNSGLVMVATGKRVP